MLQKLPETQTGLSWTPEEVEELRSSLRTCGVPAVDAEMFGKRVSEIVGHAHSQKKHARVKQRHLPDRNQVYDCTLWSAARGRLQAQD
jgi:hypothetical protein